MRKICYVCDRCGCEIDGNAAGIEIKQKDSRGYEDEAAAQGHSFSFIADALGVTRRSVEEHLGAENGGIPEE